MEAERIKKIVTEAVVVTFVGLCIVVVAVWLLWLASPLVIESIGPEKPAQPNLVAPPADIGPHAVMNLTPPDKPTLIWPVVQCLSDHSKCQVPLNRIATLRGAGKVVRLCLMVDGKAECIQLPAEWKGVE